MQNLTPEHEDQRRTLYSFAEAKVLEVKEDCVLGKHYHKLKTEIFILSKGECTVDYCSIENRGLESRKMLIGELHIIEPNTYHEFHIKAGSILIGLNSKPFDAADDYKL